ncbi:hypothetical protein D3C72_1072910 [compost metagenome]
MSPTEACASITSTLGAASRSSVGMMGASSRRRVRGSRSPFACWGVVMRVSGSQARAAALVVAAAGAAAVLAGRRIAITISAANRQAAPAVYSAGV